MVFFTAKDLSGELTGASSTESGTELNTESNTGSGGQSGGQLSGHLDRESRTGTSQELNGDQSNRQQGVSQMVKGDQSGRESDRESGRESDRESGRESTSHSIDQQILKLCSKEDLSFAEIVSKLGYSHNNPYVHNRVVSLRKLGLLEYTIPEKPNSRLQKYRLVKK